MEVAIADDDGDLVSLSGIVVYLGLSRGRSDVPNNSLLRGDRFQETKDGVAVFDENGVTTADDLP